MSIIPTVRCRRMEASIAFYTNVLDFECVEHGGDADPSFSVLMRGGSLLLLSSHGGDGTFGQAILVLTDNVDALFSQVPHARAQDTGEPRLSRGGSRGPHRSELGDARAVRRRSRWQHPTVCGGLRPGPEPAIRLLTTDSGPQRWQKCE